MMLWICFFDFAVEHWFSCCATENGFAGDIGAIEVWLTDWWSLDTLSLNLSMLMTASCLFPLHQGTQLRHWMVYSHVWPLSSNGCWRINWNWPQIKLNSSLSEMKDADNSMFPIELFSVKTTPAKSVWNLGSNIWQNFHLLLPYISSVKLMTLLHAGSAAHSQLPWSG